MRKQLLSLFGALLIVLGVAQSALATITTLTFDEFSSGTDITNQYAGVGVTVSGATALLATSSPWSANSGANLAYSKTGLMTFVFNSAITGNVQTVSLYISGDLGSGFEAFDSGGGLLALGFSPSPSDNEFFSITSLGNPIASFVAGIGQGGGTYGIDTLTFVSTAAVPEPISLALLGLGLAAMAVTRRRRPLGTS